MLSRRRFLTLSGGAAGAMVLPYGLIKAGAEEAEQFPRRMPVPPVARPVRTLRDADVYRVDIRAAEAELVAGRSTPVLTYGGSFVGPTVKAREGRRTLVTYRNRLAEPANVHLHGAYVAPDSDGHPLDVIAPGASRTYDYPNAQAGATLWYHDHAHHLEAEHCYRGLHGFHLIEGRDERALGLPSGPYDVPILLRDAAFDATGALDVTPRVPRPTILANGVSRPHFPVAARRYRFRLLNAANQRTFVLRLDGADLVQIGSDGGLLPAPVRLPELHLDSAERAEVVVDFGGVPAGTRLVLSDAVAGPILAFDVGGGTADPSRVPARLRAADPLSTPDTARDVAFAFDPTGKALINGSVFAADRVDFRVRAGSTEVWTVTNADAAIPHTFHMHLVQFRVLSRNGGPPLPQDAGRKDTVFLPPGGKVTVQATFGSQLGRYVYHCHYLEHSAIGMMAQFEVVP